MSNYVSYDDLSPSHQHYLKAFSVIQERSSYQEAITDPRWIEAMRSEIQTLQDNHTWDLVSLPPGKFPIGCRWVYKVKLESNGDMGRFKVRLVAKGYTQMEGLDFHETFSPVVKMPTVRTVLSLIVQHNWHIHLMVFILTSCWTKKHNLMVMPLGNFKIILRIDFLKKYKFIPFPQLDGVMIMKKTNSSLLKVVHSYREAERIAKYRTVMLAVN